MSEKISLDSSVTFYLFIVYEKSHQSQIIGHRHSHLEQNLKIKCHHIIRKQRIHLLTNKILFINRCKLTLLTVSV